MTIINYGTAAAPYLAIRAIKQLVENKGAAFPLGTLVIQSDMYVDGVVTGANIISDNCLLLFLQCLVVIYWFTWLH